MVGGNSRKRSSPWEHDLPIRGTVVVGNQAARDAEIAVTGPDDEPIAMGHTSADGSFKIVLPVSCGRGIPVRLPLEITAPDLDIFRPGRR